MSVDTEGFDPTAPEGDVAGRGQYVTKRDVKIVGIGLVGFLFLMSPLYFYMKGNSERSRCASNMKAIIQALNMYTLEHDSRYPPLARTESEISNVPSLGETGKAYTWAADIAGYMNTRATFQCPSAKGDEVMLGEDPKTLKASLATSYGMYLPYGGYLTSLIEFPDQAIIVAETSNRGARETYDPLPFTSTMAGAQNLPDGYAIGWDNSNDAPDKKTKSVTRLAFPGSKSGNFMAANGGRHFGVINALSASGERRILSPTDAMLIDPKDHSPNLAWRIPVGYKKANQ